jgi:hypothetical protein
MPWHTQRALALYMHKICTAQLLQIALNLNYSSDAGSPSKNGLYASVIWEHMGHDAVLLDEWLPIFWRNTVPSSSAVMHFLQNIMNHSLTGSHPERPKSSTTPL